ncbi:hypothetical protein UFOVP43_27 [uncultured Caudovirales phage]|uniref:Uncharacterized protein n=1 Tax=uncultured Caudovirales phage TaxID=2100421 RepID=A0A6J5KQ91_9CAUD|nr:hypothetical protein UFOVP43_27 [uncultured Caudovirales phage]
MTTWIPLLGVGMIANAVTIFVLFAPPAQEVFHNHPECSIASFSPDLTSKQKAFCREWTKR